MNSEIEYYIDTIIKQATKACSIRHREDYEDSIYLHNEYNKCFKLIQSNKYKILKYIAMKDADNLKIT